MDKLTILDEKQNVFFAKKKEIFTILVLLTHQSRYQIGQLAHPLNHSALHSLKCEIFLQGILLHLIDRMIALKVKIVLRIR